MTSARQPIRLGPAAVLLRALEMGMPIRAFVFVAGGRLAWPSRQALKAPVRPPGGPNQELAAEIRELRRIARAALARSPELPRLRARFERTRLGPTARLAVERVAEPGSPPCAVLAIVERGAAQPDGLARAPLAPREAEVAALAAQGCSILNIALRQHVSENTVRTQLKRVYRKLGVASRAELALRLAPFFRDAGPASGPKDAS